MPVVKRREFITLLGGAAAAWPLAARAQQPERVPRVVVWFGGSMGDPGVEKRAAAFRNTLRGLGWVDGRNVRIENRATIDTQQNLAELPNWLHSIRTSS